MPVNGTFSGADLWCVDRVLNILRLRLCQRIRQVCNDGFQQVGIQLGKPVMQGASGVILRDLALQRGKNRSCVQPRLHTHGRHAGARVASGDCALNWCRTAPARQQ